MVFGVLIRSVICFDLGLLGLVFMWRLLVLMVVIVMCVIIFSLCSLIFKVILLIVRLWCLAVLFGLVVFRVRLGLTLGMGFICILLCLVVLW